MLAAAAAAAASVGEKSAGDALAVDEHERVAAGNRQLGSLLAPEAWSAQGTAGASAKWEVRVQISLVQRAPSLSLSLKLSAHRRDGACGGGGIVEEALELCAPSRGL